MRTAPLPKVISRLDLCSVRARLVEVEEGPGWSRSLCRVAEREYKRYLTLALENPETPVVPNKLIDEVWHFHLLDTAKYEMDVTAIFGKFLHHNPNFGRGSKQQKRRLQAAFRYTKKLYKSRFGQDMTRIYPELANSASSCQQMCSSSCTK